MTRRAWPHPAPESPEAKRTGDAPEPGHTGDEPPPVFGRWKHIYILVVAELAALIALFYLFTKTFE